MLPPAVLTRMSKERMMRMRLWQLSIVIPKQCLHLGVSFANVVKVKDDDEDDDDDGDEDEIVVAEHCDYQTVFALRVIIRMTMMMRMGLW